MAMHLVAMGVKSRHPDLGQQVLDYLAVHIGESKITARMLKG